MIVDVCTYNGEEDLWDLHYNVLKAHVDQFIVCEAPTTFSGQPKPLYFEQIRHQYPDVSYYVIDENWTEEEKMVAWNSPNTVGAAHWTREFLQKESIKKSLTHLADADVVFVGDVDEIWDAKAIKLYGTYKLKLKVYTYYLNNRSNEQFWGTLKTTYGHMKHLCLNHLRTNAIRTKHYNGWHFTSMKDQLPRKLTDSYTQESYATPLVLENLAYNIEHNRDFLGRDFTYELNETAWPPYLKQHRAQYEQLLRV